MKGSKVLAKVYETDASRFKGNVSEVVWPKDVNEVCLEVAKNEGIVPRGAGTGFSGGVVPINSNDVVMDLSKMDSIKNLDLERKTVEVECGVVLNDLNYFLGALGFEFPVDILSWRVATIGGMIATNAVGRRAIKYGSVSNQIKWVDVVDFRGEVSRKGVTEMSDFVGMEGITGVVVRACLKINRKKNRSVEVISFRSFEDVVSRVADFKRDPRVSFIEFFDEMTSNFLDLGGGYHLVVEYEDLVRSPVDEFNSKRDILVGREYDKLISKLGEIYSVVALEGYTRIEDPKVMSDRWIGLFEWMRNLGVPVFGSISVGIMHPCFNMDQERHIPEMIKMVKRLGGQSSGSFGVGILKKQFVEVNDRKILVNVKKRCDPLNKFNMGKVI